MRVARTGVKPLVSLVGAPTTSVSISCQSSIAQVTEHRARESSYTLLGRASTSYILMKTLRRRSRTRSFRTKTIPKGLKRSNRGDW